MITRIVHTENDSYTGQKTYTIPNEIIEELSTKGLAFPDPVHVSYNFGVKKIYKVDESGNRVNDETTGKSIVVDSYPTLTTIVNWATGDKTVVVNSKCDGLQLDENGKPTEFAKECGFAFAVTKKLLTSKYEMKNGELTISQEGFSNKLSEIVKNSTDLQMVEEQRKNRKIEAEKRRMEAKKRHEEKMKQPKRLSLAEAMDKLSVALKEIEELKKNYASMNAETSSKTMA